MLLTSPAGYLLAGASLAPLRKPLQRWLNVTATLVCAVALLNGAPRIAANIDAVGEDPFADRIDFLPVGAQIKLGQIWRNECDEIANPQLQYWTASAKQTAKGIRQGGAQFGPQSNVWQVKPDGGTCTSRMSFEPAPPFATLLAAPITLSLNTDTQVVTYRSMPVDEAALRAHSDMTQPLWLSLNWLLLSQSSPAQAHAGQPITLTQAWRIVSLPEAAHDDWDYTLYVHLVSSDGTTTPLVETGQLPPGVLWRAGDYVLSEVSAALSADLAPGEYTLQLSLYDRVRKDTAVYFEFNERNEPVWEKPMLALTRTLTLS